MGFEFDDKTKMLFEKEKMGKLLFMMSFPVIIAIIISAIYNIADTIYIGRSVGTLGVAGIGIGFPIQLMVNSLGLLIGMGGSSVISRALGNKNLSKANSTIGMTFLIGTILYLIILVTTMPSLESVVKGLGATDEIIPYAMDYLKIIIPGSIFILLAVGIGNLFMAQGKPELSMMQLVVGAILNIALDPIFIFVFKMGIKGAAIATVISQGLSFAMVMYFQFSKRTSLIPKFKDFIQIKFKIIGEVIALGTPAFLQEVGASVLIVVVNNVLFRIGGAATTSLLAVFGILNKMLIFLITPLIGIAQGFMPIAGYNFGAKNFERIKEAFKKASISAFLLTLIIIVIILLIPSSILSLFTNDNALIDAGILPLRIMYIALPFVTFNVMASMYFMGIGKAIPAAILSLARQVIILIPLLLVLSRIFGLMGLWVSFPIADILSVIVALIWMKKEMYSISKV